jgi:small ligand-binding sensory domain FIST
VLGQAVGPVPLGGFFAGGEFGPIGGTNFVHSFTASIALFRDR